MKLKRVSVVLLMVMLITTLTGCVQFEIGLELNSDNTGKLVSSSAVNVDLVDEEDSTTNVNLVEDLDGIENVKGVKVKREPLEYQVDGDTYKGEKVEISFDNTVDFFKEAYSESGEVKLIDLGNGKMRLEVPFEEEVASESDTEDEGEDIDFDFYSMIKGFGGRIQFTIKTDYKVTKHNADKVENGVYIWDILNRIVSGNTETAFIEYENTKTSTEQSKPLVVKSFSDVSKNHWAYNDIMILFEKGIVSGVTIPNSDGVGTYAPDGTVTLSQFLAISTRLVAEPYIKSENVGEIWYTQYYNAAVESGLISKSEFSFGAMDKGISREDMAHILVKVAEKNGEILNIKDGIKNKIKDFSSISVERQDAVLKAYSNGLLVGDNMGNFNPKNVLTRAQVAAVFCRVMNFTERPVVN